MAAMAVGLALVVPPAAAQAGGLSAPDPTGARQATHVASRGPAPTVTYYSLTKKIRSPFWITPGPDGNMWFTNPTGDTIGRVTPAGVVTEFQLAKGTLPKTITAGADGNLWFTMQSQDKIGVMDTSGNLLHQYSAEQTNATPYSIAPSPDGAVWFTDYNTDDPGVLDKVERMTLDGNTVDKFDLSTCACAPLGVTYGPDGNMWFTEELGFTPDMQGNGDGTVDRVSLDGKTIDRFAVRTDFTQALPSFMAPGPDGNVWFTEASAETHNLDRVTPQGTVTEFHIADTFASTNAVTTGADGDIWFTEAGTSDGDIWRMNPNGALIGQAIPVHFNPIGIALGPDGNVWFASREDGEIGKLHVAPAGRSFVLDIASGFSPAVRTVSLGRTVEWVLEAPGTHRVQDSTGMGLFDSGPQAPVSFSTFRFPAAGAYPYVDRPGGRRGKVQVGIDAPSTGHVATSLRLTWATAGAPSGALFDVQVQRPGDHTFSDLRTGTMAHGGAFTPHDPGLYRFRSRMRTAGGGTGYSPVHSIRVS
jgi:virginiamycin B lyase